LSTIEFLADIDEKNSQPTSQYYGICQKYARISKLVLTLGLSLYLASLMLAAFAGSIETILTGTYKPTAFIYFPGIREYSTEIMVLSVVFNHMMVATALLILPPPDMFFFILFANMPMVPMIINGHLDELSKLLEQKRNAVNAMEIKRRIVQLIQMQRRYNE
jgi:hypothetical protein